MAGARAGGPLEGVLPDGPRASAALVTAAAPVRPRIEVEWSLSTVHVGRFGVRAGVPRRAIGLDLLVGV